MQSVLPLTTTLSGKALAIQDHIAFASYWHDPLNYTLWLKDNNFLADINNARDVKNPKYRANMASLNAFLMMYTTAGNIAWNLSLHLMRLLRCMVRLTLATCVHLVHLHCCITCSSSSVLSFNTFLFAVFSTPCHGRYHCDPEAESVV